MAPQGLDMPGYQAGITPDAAHGRPYPVNRGQGHMPSSLVGRLAVADHQASELPAAGFTGLYSE
jgi:hypothetical protein